MAGIKYTAETSVAQAVSTTTAKTVVAVKAPANQRVEGLQVEFYPSNNSAKIDVIFYIADGTGDGTGTGITLKKKNPSHTETLQSTGKENFTVEPTTVVWSETRSMQGPFAATFPEDDLIDVPGGKTYGVKMVSDIAVNVRAILTNRE